MKIRPRVVQIHDPDLLLLCWIFRLHGIKVVYDVHEDFTRALLSRGWIGPPVIRWCVAFLVGKFEILSSRILNGVILADSQLGLRFSSVSSVVVRNYIDTSEWPPIPADKLTDKDILRCIYVGDITEPRGLTRMCDAVYAANQAGHDVQLEMIGPVSSTVRQTVSNHPAAAYIELYGWGSRSEVAERMGASNVAFCLLEPTPAYRDALPVKVLEYIVSGLPVVATDLPRLRQEKALKGAFQLVQWDAPTEVLATAIKQASLTNLEERKYLRKVVIDHYEWSIEARKLTSFYKNLLHK